MADNHGRHGRDTMNLGQLYKAWRAWRKLKPYFTKERLAGMGRKTWITIIVGVAGVIAKAVGLPDEQWKPIADWLLSLLLLYFGANVAEHGAEAIKAFAAKKNGTPAVP